MVDESLWYIVLVYISKHAMLCLCRVTKNFVVLVSKYLRNLIKFVILS